MSTPYKHVVLVWPVALPGTGELRVEIDAAEDGIAISRESDGALVLWRGSDVVRIARPEIESATLEDGARVDRAHAGDGDVGLEREGGVVVLYRPVGRAELDLVIESGWRAFPPRLPEQPIFYPVTNEQYAREIATKWNARDGQGVYVLKFRVPASVAERWSLRRVGARHHTELWIPAEELGAINAAIVGEIERLATLT